MHFSAFYRRSWRANDFMWGRLDGATRVVDLLVESSRAEELSRRGGHVTDTAAVLTDAVLPPNSPADVRHALVEEAFQAAQTAGSGVAPEVRDMLRTYTGAADARLLTATRAPDELRDHLRSALALDLVGGDARFTRAILARALQLEIVREEYDTLARETRKDAAAGAYSDPLEETGADAMAAINTIRALYRTPPGSTAPRSLPEALGLGDGDEATSDLALRTVSKTLYALLATVRRNVILGRLLAIVRAPLLPFSGVVSASRLVRAFVLVGFAAAVGYLTARLIGSDPQSDGSFGSLWNPSVLLTWVAVLVIVGAIAVPGLRALRTRRAGRKLLLSLLALALAAGAVIAPLTLAWVGGGLRVAQLLATPGTDNDLPGKWGDVVLAITFGAPLVLALASYSFAAPVRDGALRLLDRYLPLPLILGAMSGSVLAWSVRAIVRDAHWLGWSGYAVLGALAAVVLFGIYLFPQPLAWLRKLPAR